MPYLYYLELISAVELQLALADRHPESTHGAVPMTDHQDAIEAYRAYDDGGLCEAPNALAAYRRSQNAMHN